MKRIFVFSFKRYFACLIFGSVLVASFVALFKRIQNVFLVLDSVFLSALVMVCIGGFYLTKALGFYDFTVFSFKKFFKSFGRQSLEDKNMSYIDYLNTAKQDNSIMEFFAAGLTFFIVYIVFRGI